MLTVSGNSSKLATYTGGNIKVFKKAIEVIAMVTLAISGNFLIMMFVASSTFNPPSDFSTVEELCR